MIFSPIGAAIKARYSFLWARCPACRATGDLRGLDRYPDAAVTSLTPSLSCRSCRPHAPFAELVVRLSDKSIADELREEHTRRLLGECTRRRGCTCPTNPVMPLSMASPSRILANASLSSRCGSAPSQCRSRASIAGMFGRSSRVSVMAVKFRTRLRGWKAKANRLRKLRRTCPRTDQKL
jgi:hypothetical protein